MGLHIQSPPARAIFFHKFSIYAKPQIGLILSVIETMIFMNYQLPRFPRQEIVTGTVVSLDAAGALIDVGLEKAIYLPAPEISLAEIESLEEVLPVGQKREFLMITNRDREGNISMSLSMKALEERVAWERVRQLQAENVTVYATVVKVTEGYPLLVGKVEGLCGQIFRHEVIFSKPLEELVGEELPVKFVKVDELHRSLILSQRRALLEPVIKHFKVGDVVSGKVGKLRPYGVWIDIGQKIIALLRISEISHEPTTDRLDSIFKENEDIQAMIVSIDLLRCRIELSTKLLEPAPGDMLKNPQFVYDNAEKMAEKYRQKIVKKI